MLYEKRKGFTLVELIAAMAILSIVMASVSLAFSSSYATWKRDNVSMELYTLNQTLSENLRASGKKKITEMYDASSEGKTLNCYFNDAREINDGMQQGTLFNGSGRGARNAATVKIEKEQQDNYYPLYKLTVTVWNQKEGKECKSQSTFYVGR